MLGEHGNWMRLRDSLFSWGRIWRSSPAPLWAYLWWPPYLCGQPQVLLSPASPLGASFSLSSPGRGPHTSSPGFNWDKLWLSTGTFSSGHLDTVGHASGPKLPPWVVLLQTECRPSLLTFAHCFQRWWPLATLVPKCWDNFLKPSIYQAGKKKSQTSSIFI